MKTFTDINQPRIEKIMKMLDTIETSAKSNKAQGELAGLLAPVFDRLGGGENIILEPKTTQNHETPEANTRGKTTSGQTPAAWFALRQAAEEAPIEQLTPVMAVIMSRVDDLIHSQK